MAPIKLRLTVDDYLQGIRRGDRVLLSQAITLAESSLPADEQLAALVMEQILPYTGKSIRIGITGAPGVGKSSFIEAFGKYITELDKQTAVLTIDPSSPLTKGSILGDKTRMEELARNPKAFVRPSPSGNSLGGIAHKTREALLLCEAAGFEVIIVETVGVGQSEVAVKNMVDFFLLLVLARAGDELQGIKKGIMEMADAVIVTKADGDNIRHAEQAQAEYQYALHLSPASASGWSPKVMVSSAVTGTGLDKVWTIIEKFRKEMLSNGFFDSTRRQQNISWFEEYFNQLLKSDLQKFPVLREQHAALEELVRQQTLSSYGAAHRLLQTYYDAIRGKF